jgi:hypothetical protein
MAGGSGSKARRGPGMVVGAGTYQGDGVAWKRRDGVGAMVLNSDEARGGWWRLGLGSDSTLQGGGG